MAEEKFLTKKERRMQQRQERRDVAEELTRARRKRRIFWWGGAACALALLVVAVVRVAGRTDIPAQLGAVGAVMADEWIKGNPTASATLIEYSDFQCPACRAYAPLVKQLGEEFGGNLRIVYRHFPLRRTHANADIAGRAAEAAGLQSAFWTMYDMLFERQDAWANIRDAEDVFTQYAAELGLDAAQFRRDIASDAVAARVEEDLRSGLAAGINATPTFFLNGERMQNPRDYASFSAAVREAITASSAVMPNTAEHVSDGT